MGQQQVGGPFYNSTEGNDTSVAIGEITGMTEGAVAFGAANGSITQDATNLFWDDSNNRLGIGIATPASKGHFYQDDATADTTTGVTIEQDGTGDAILQFSLTGLQRWVMGIDNSDSDKYKIASSDGLVSDARFTISTTGDVGIGDTSPDARLDVTVSDTENVTALSVVNNDTTNNTNYLQISGASTGIGIDMSAFSVDQPTSKFVADAITTAGTVSHQIAIDIGGTTFYLVAYTHGS